MRITPTPTYSRISLNNAISKENVELAAFYAFARRTVPEVALTEFAARVCYNSTAKLGTSPNFVSGVLSHGHLSVAEHASLAVKNNHIYSGDIQKINRFFTRGPVYTAGNMRSWLEFLAKVDYAKKYEVFLSVFPPAFAEDPMLSQIDPKTLEVPQNVNVPSFDNVHLLAANLGSIPKSTMTTERNEFDTWGRFTFLLEGISRACSHQIARHRGASISEQSLRYVDASKIVSFTYPENVTDAQREVLKFNYELAFNAYSALRASGMKKEDARFVLPLAMQTRMVISFDKKELLHFLRVRCAKDAQWEVRLAAEKMAMQALLATGSVEFEKLVNDFGIGEKIGRTTEG